jgi:hypothetical protein
LQKFASYKISESTSYQIPIIPKHFIILGLKPVTNSSLCLTFVDPFKYVFWSCDKHFRTIKDISTNYKIICKQGFKVTTNWNWTSLSEAFYLDGMKEIIQVINKTYSIFESDKLHSELRILDWKFYQVCSQQEIIAKNIS